MPRYTYQCGACGEIWTQWGSMSDSLPPCPSCQTNDVARLPSSFSVVKKGSHSREKEVGEVTKEHIENARDDLKEWKEELKTKEYKPDD